MKSILAKIVAHKKAELRTLMAEKPLAALKKEALRLPRRRPGRFLGALKVKNGVAVIAEIKQKSPSKGVLRKRFNAVKIACAYKKGGARALSVLTDHRFFGGSAADLVSAKKAARLPVLRKDFIVHEYQLWESRLLGADGVLLIAAILKPRQLKKLMALARWLGMDALVEVHSRIELAKVLPLQPTLIGVNNRNLRTFEVDLRTTERLAPRVPKQALLVSESGIKTSCDVERLRRVGVRAVLVGESLITKKNIARALQTLRGRLA